MIGWENAIGDLDRFKRRFEFDCPMCGGHRSIVCIPISVMLENCVKLCIECENCKKQVYRAKLGFDATDEEIHKVQKEEVESLVNYFKPELKWKMEDAVKSASKMMSFSEALNECINGKRITREDWNGKGMFVYYTPGHKVKIEDWFNRADGGYPTEEEKKRGYIELAGHFDMYNAQGLRIIGWLASQTDMASNNWYVVE